MTGMETIVSAPTAMLSLPASKRSIVDDVVVRYDALRRTTVAQREVMTIAKWMEDQANKRSHLRNHGPVVGLT